MRKALVYSVAAVVLGLVLTLVLPLPLAEIRNEEFGQMAKTMSAESYNLEPLRTTVSLYSVTDFGLLALCLVIALTAYAVLRHRIFSS
jgi:energy-coupling factor transporter transmembrane protein EcfT